MRLKAEKGKNRLVNLSIEKKRSLRVQYKAQARDEREAKRAADSNMKKYQDRVNTLRDQVFIVLSKLGIQEEEVRKLKEQYLEAERELGELRQKFKV